MQRVLTWSEIRAGDIWHSCSLEEPGQVIRHFTKRPDLVDEHGHPLPPSRSPNHTGVVWGEENGCLHSVEALTRVEFTALSNYFPEWQAGRLYVFRPPAGPGLEEDLAWLRSQVGKGYGWEQVTWAAIQQRARRWFGLDLPVVGRRGWICSELGFVYLRRRYQHTQASMLEWTIKVRDQNSVYPAYLMAACQQDRLPGTW